jgi:NitT/TauT family transport system substrate-binding protein
MKKLCIAILFVLTSALASLQSRAADKPFLFGLPGNPPVFLSVQVYVAVAQGFFKKYGIDAQVRAFETGTTAARAVASGEIDFAISPTPIVISAVANSGTPLVGIYGLENPDWLIGSTDPAVRSCQDLPGKPIGIDASGGARWTALRQMTAPSPCNLNMESLQFLALGSNTSTGLISGQIKIAVLHLDDLAEVEDKLGRPLVTVITLKRVKPISHYDLFIARPDRLVQDRDRFVRVLAALIEAEAFMRSSKNWDRVAQIAAPTGRSAAAAKASLTKYLEFEFWPNGHDGLDQRKVESEIKAQASLGAIGQGKVPPTYESLVDRSLFQEALALTKKKQ